MTPSQAQALKVNDTIIWDGNPLDQGTVIDVQATYASIKVIASGRIGVYRFDDAAAWANVEKMERESE